ncbi:hypothetical protein [Flavobacterium wongokense]|uniref:hypothetical protein n=1 Tax=Flavobacterium wongokense TaxID=2910674 RepID=UPI001F217EB1|nr:hypothetical protein [Flavobacterium sp. WG47]MCF6131714.1 hypothetical protein [Flavobacterium sp. WG47]
MKKLQLITSIMLLAILSFSCSSSSDDSPNNCEDATAATATAAQAFANATNENYAQLCAAYKDALQDQIASCGDPNGDLQDLVDGLNCTVPTTTGTLSMHLGSAPLEFDRITVTTTGTTRHVHGERSDTTSYEINFDVEVGQTGANKINNFQLRLFSQTYTPLIPAVFGNEWGNNITINTSSSIVGTFHGELANPGQTSAQDLLGGVVDIDF